MKATITHLVLWLAVLAVGLVGFSASPCRAQGEPEATNVVEVTSMPEQGIFYSIVRGFPPSPFDPFPDLPLYTEDPSSGIYFYDDRRLDHSSPVAGGGVHADDAPSPPGGVGSGGGSWSPPVIPIPSYTITYDCHDWTNFWLVISNTGTAAQVGIESTLSGTVYNVLTNSELNTSNWGVYQTIVATSSITWSAPLSFTASSNLFFKATVTWPTLLWTRSLPGQEDEWGGGVDASPALSLDGSTVYIPCTSNLLYALDAFTGAPTASNALITGYGELTSSAAIASNGDVYLGSIDGWFYSFTSNLIPNWSNNLASIEGSTVQTVVSVYATPTVTASGTVYVGTAGNFVSNGFFSFNAASNENWFFPPVNSVSYNGDGFGGGNVSSSAAVGADGTIYFLAEDWRLYALYPDGNVKWYLPMSGYTNPDSSPAIAADGTIVCGSDSPYVYAVNPDGSMKWSYHVGTNDRAEAIFSSPVIDSNGTVYIGAAQPNPNTEQIFYFNTLTNLPTGIYAINEGELLWSFTNVSGWVVGSCALGADGTVYAGAASTYHTFGTFYAISNGVQEWSFQTDGDIVSSPVIASDGGVIFGCEDGNVYKLAGCTTLADAPWPMFHHDPQHTGSLAGTNVPTPGSEPPFLSNGNFTDAYPDHTNYFTFSVVGSNSTTWAVYASTNLVSWTNTHQEVGLDATGQGTFFTNALPNGQRTFYCLSNGCGSKIIGFVRFNLMPGTNLMMLGTNLIANPFYQVDDNAMFDGCDQNFLVPCPLNTVATLFSGIVLQSPWQETVPLVPTNTTFANWTGNGFVTDTNNNNQNNEPPWYPNSDVTLLPGIGAMVVLPTNQIAAPVWFIGLVRQSVTNQIHVGTNYLGSALPIEGGISSVLGFTNATWGDTIVKWNPTNQHFVTYSNYGGANWSNNEPYIGLAEGFILMSASNHTWVQTCPPSPGN